MITNLTISKDLKNFHLIIQLTEIKLTDKISKALNFISKEVFFIFKASTHKNHLNRLNR